MRFNVIVALLVCSAAYSPVNAHPPIYSNEPPAVDDSGGNNDDGGGYATPQLNFASVHLQHQQRVNNSKPMATSKTSTSQSPTAEAISASTSANTPLLQSAYVYSAQVPSQIQPEANKVVSPVKLASSTTAAMSDAALSSIQSDSTGPNGIVEMYSDSSKKNIGSSSPSSIAVILNGNEPQFTDALGQKVPKPMPSLQVASPIDLLNPDRYEFFTFDENGDLVKRLMTVKEIQSIVANGDGEGPTIIHHGPVDDRDPEKNVQDIVNSVQDVLNKEVESNKNSSSNILPVLDTPDVSASWSMILPAVFGNTGGVDIFSHQKPQQILMTPDTEIVETSTKTEQTSTTKKAKPSRRKPVQKRKPTTSTTEVTPQVIQEELESHESVYTGMQQYQHLAATMHDYEGFTQLHMQPIYHKLPEQVHSETTTKQVGTKAEETVTEALDKNPLFVQNKPLPPPRVKKPNGGSTSTKRPQGTKKNNKRKPTTTTTTKPETITVTESIPLTPGLTTSPSTMTTEVIVPTTLAGADHPLVSESPERYTTTHRPISSIPKKKKKKPTRQPVHSSPTLESTSNRKPEPTVPAKTKPTQKPQDTTTDLTAEGTAHQEVSQNKHQQVTYHKPRPKPQKPTKTPIKTTTVIIAPVPMPTVQTPQEPSLIVEPFPGYVPSVSSVWTKVTTEKPDVTSTTPNTIKEAGTSGYPVPDIFAMPEHIEDDVVSQYKPQSLPRLPIIEATTQKIYPDQDINAMQSFDQILQSLKQSEIGTEPHTDHTQTSFKPPINPVKYDSAESLDLLESMANKHKVIVKGQTVRPVTEFSSSLSEEATTQYTVSSPEVNPEITTVAPIEDTTITDNQAISKIDTELTILDENNSEETSPLTEVNETPDTTMAIETTQSPPVLEESVHTTELVIEDSTTDEDTLGEHTTLISTLREDTTLANTDEESTTVSGLLEVKYDKIQTRLPVSSPHNKDTALDDDKDTYNQPILVADLKPQLNMEVLQPSEQISMSEFQTQAATVASTLVDGANTLAVEHNVMNSNETKDEIEFLLSDVIKQISDDQNTLQNLKKNQADSDQSNSQPQQQTQINDHYSESVEELSSSIGADTFSDTRFSNFAKINTSFLLMPIGSNKLSHLNDDTVTQNLKGINDSFDIVPSDIDDINFRPTISSDTTAMDDTTEEVTMDVDQENQNMISESESGEDADTTTVSELNIVDKTTENIQNLESETKNYSVEIKNEDTEDLTDVKVDTTTPSLETFQSDNENTTTFFETDNTIETTTLSESPNTEKDNLQDVTSSKSVVQSTSETTKYDYEGEETTDRNFEPTSLYTTEKSEEITSNEDSETTTVKLDKDFASTEDLNENSTEFFTEQLPEDSETNATNNEQQQITDLVTEEIEKYSMDRDPTTEIAENTTEENGSQSSEETTIVSTQGTTNMHDNIEKTTLQYDQSEQTSEEFDTEDLVDEDPYIKLGETTTTPRIIESLTTPTTQIITLKPQAEESNIEATNSKIEVEHMLDPPRPISSVTEPDTPVVSESNNKPEKLDQTSDEADEEDEDDQFGYQSTKLETSPSTKSPTSSTSTTPKPTISTTRRLNTLKPVSYFNKQPAYALYSDTVEPLYSKPVHSQSLPENIPNKLMVFTIPTPQQRPMHRPPQLSNLYISSSQATRPPVKLEPSPLHSKGLEASLAHLDEDILGFARLCNELAFSYWKSITSEKISSTRSLVLSPFALTSMLSMVFLGARGSTSGEMNDVLKLDDMVTFNPHLVFKNITDSVEKATDSDIATTAFVREVFSDRANGKILQFFKEKTQQFYSGHVEEVNFHVVNDIIRRRTNLLVKRHTMGKVLEYLRTNSVWVNGPLATISANLFQTDCSQGSTVDRDGEIFFQVHPTVRQRRLVPIPAVLFKTGFTAGYEPNLAATVVAFGRIQDTTSMIYVMPSHHSSLSPSENLDRLEKELMETAISKNTWSNLLTSLMDRPGMEVQLPRFSHRSFVNATLGLQKMGLKGLFKSDFADLGGLTGSSNRDIYLSDMIQINTFSTCGEEKIADHHHVEMYPAPPLRKRNKDVEAHQDDDMDSSEAIIDFGSLVQDSALGRGFYDDLLDPKYLELPLPLRPRQARVPDTPRLRFDKPFLYFVRHNPTGMILFMGRFNPRLLP